MKCPYCGHPESKVIDSRPVEENSSIRRRRECLGCQARFTTYEVIETFQPVVVKKDGSREYFDRNKLLVGILKACQKRDIAVFFLVLQEGSNTAISIAATVRIICRLFRVNIIILLFYGFLKFTAHRAATSAGEAIVYHIINADVRF